MKLIVFDLDGTLIDSRRDLATAVNHMRGSMELDPLPIGTIVNFIGNGINSLVLRSIADADVDADTALQRMKRFYAEHLVDTTKLYPGVAKTLQLLSRHGSTLAVFSNKSEDFTNRILTQLGISGNFSDIIGGDGKYPLKPAPDALLALKEKYHAAPDDCWMVGDHCTDLEVAHRAGFHSIFCNYGIGNAGDWHYDFEISGFSELVDAIR